RRAVRQRCPRGIQRARWIERARRIERARWVRRGRRAWRTRWCRGAGRPLSGGRARGRRRAGGGRRAPRRGGGGGWRRGGGAGGGGGGSGGGGAGPRGRPQRGPNRRTRQPRRSRDAEARAEPDDLLGVQPRHRAQMAQAVTESGSDRGDELAEQTVHGLT